MSRFMSRRFDRLDAYVPGEQPRDKKYIKLNTNESPYPPAPGVAEALSAGEIADLRLYGDPNCTALREKLAERFGVETRNVFVGNGSDEVLDFAFMAFCDEKTGVSYPDISYGFYPVYADLYNLKKNELPLRSDLSIDPKDYMNANSTVVIANPNAPTGLCLSVKDIEAIVKSNRDNVVVIDEAYVDFGAESCAGLIGAYDNLLVVQTFSKSRSLAGARLGFALGNRELIEDLEKLRFSTNPFNVNRLTALAGIAALYDIDYYDNKNAEIVETRDKTACEMKNMGFELTESRTNFLFARHAKVRGIELYLGLRDRGILVRHFSKPPIDEYVRITVGTPEQMRTLCAAMKEMLENA